MLSTGPPGGMKGAQRFCGSPAGGAGEQRAEPGSITAAGPPGGKRCLLPASFVLNSCRNKPHQRCQSLSPAFRFKAKFPAVRSLSSTRNPNSPPGVTPGQALHSKPSCYKANWPSPQVVLSWGPASFRSTPPQLLHSPGLLTPTPGHRRGLLTP